MAFINFTKAKTYLPNRLPVVAESGGTTITYLSSILTGNVAVDLISDISEDVAQSISATPTINGKLATPATPTVTVT